MLANLTLILGGQRSGKSAYAESLLANGAVYLATGHASDPEMAERIEAHQERRGEGWVTVEEPLDLVHALTQAKKLHSGKPVLIDSLGMWVSNMLHAQKSPVVEAEIIAQAMRKHPDPVIVVSDEVGLGVISMNPVARSFVDALGFVNQITAAQANRVVLVVAGLPQELKNQ
ncbi:bifunctional adenosylcobinamide kinase/adenosylcobinamide-phosphate guanylyltransferase [Magnetovibrio sp. PR-2]|uniref:bifunctional adenosylcobinamide kinase/adenosylcobinamide-phosphate guanylyltransferase n=1 Tax=Magnetovibrio sp. PR-2 TaxID=3120356 RepID=UPI002FCE06DD